MASRDGEYCFSYLSHFCIIFLHFLNSVSGQSFHHLIPYDAGNVVILIIVPFCCRKLPKVY